LNEKLLIDNDNIQINKNIKIINKENKFNIPPLAILENKLVEYNKYFIIYNGCKFNLIKRKNDIKKEYRDNKNYIIYSCMHRRKDEPN
jgi:hypothetical protein